MKRLFHQGYVATELWFSVRVGKRFPLKSLPVSLRVARREAAVRRA